MIKSSLFSKVKFIQHAFFKKNVVYNNHNHTINFSKNNNPNLQKNKGIITNLLKIPNHKLIIPKQIHSNNVVDIDINTKHQIIADGLITTKKNYALGILTADCLPIIVCSIDLPMVGIFHGGRRGLQENIIKAGIDMMKTKGGSNFIACIGPHIHKFEYEVSEDIYKDFCQQEPNYHIFFSKCKKHSNKYFLDLTQLCVKLLKSEGIQNIDLIKPSTYPTKNGFYSYRYSQHNKNIDYGNQISIIALT